MTVRRVDDEPKSSFAVKMIAEGGSPKSPILNISPVVGNDDEVSSARELALSEFQHSNATQTSDVSQPELINDEKVPTSNKDMSATISNQANANGFPRKENSADSHLPNNCQEILPVAKESSPHLGDVKSSNVLERKALTDGMKEGETEINVMVGSQSNAGEKDTCETSPSSKPKEMVSLPDYPANDQKYVTEASVSCDDDAEVGESCPRNTASPNLGSDECMDECQLKNGAVDCETPACTRNADDLKLSGEDGHAEAMQNVSSNGYLSRMIENPEDHGEETSGADDDNELLSKTNSEARGENSIVPIDIFNPTSDTQDWNDMANSCMELEYGVDDALEVALQVAKEVEREVMDYRGPFCSSSPEKISEYKIKQFVSSDSLEVKHDEHMMEKLNGVKEKLPTKQDVQENASSPEMTRFRISGNIDSKPQDNGNESGSPTETAVARDLVGDTGRSKCDFDLNEVCTEDSVCMGIPVANQYVTLSAPIPVVAASNGMLVLPCTPLHFDGKMGWRGSASTSAFLPAFPRRTTDDGTSLADASSNSPTQRQSFLHIDLNVTNDGNEAAADIPSAKEIPVSSRLSSGESSIEISSRREKMLKFDLNCLGDGDSDSACPFPSSDWRAGGTFHLQNGHRSLSPALSSSTEQSPMRDFNLNDNLVSVNSHGSQAYRPGLYKSSLQDTKGYGSLKLDDPLMSITGSRANVDKKEAFHHTHSVPNVQTSESSVCVNSIRLSDVSGAQPSIAYAQSLPPVSGYNDFTMSPFLSFPLQRYRPSSSLSYAVDSRGATVVPQVLGSRATISSQSYCRPPFLMSLTGAPTGLAGVAVSPSGLDLNPGMVSVGGESREVGNLLHAMHPAGTGMTLKRKEPEGGGELNMVGYTHDASWC